MAWAGLSLPLLFCSIPSYLYWTDWGDHSLIGKIGMDGTNRSVIVDTKITWPNGLTLDYINSRIYWADAREDYIEFASLDGSNRHTGESTGVPGCHQDWVWSPAPLSRRRGLFLGRGGVRLSLPFPLLQC